MGGARLPGYLAFQLEPPPYVAPTWPVIAGEPQTMTNLDLGATLPEHQPQDDVRVLLDPAGHPFSLYT